MFGDRLIIYWFCFIGPRGRFSFCDLTGMHNTWKCKKLLLGSLEIVFCWNYEIAILGQKKFQFWAKEGFNSGPKNASCKKKHGYCTMCNFNPIIHLELSVPCDICCVKFHYALRWIFVPKPRWFEDLCLLSTDLPSCGSTQEVVPVSYTIYNRTNMVQEVEGEIEPSDDFMFSGNSQVDRND